MLETAKIAPAVPKELASLVSSQSASCRFDPIQGNWTIFAPFRQQRPKQFDLVADQPHTIASACPFCIGAELETPDPVWIGKALPELDNSNRNADAATGLALMERIDSQERLKNEDHSDWLVRVVPNKFPAISPQNHHLGASSTGTSNLFREHPVFGGHEVIIESPQHVESIVELDAANLALVFAAYRDRLRHWHDVQGIRYLSLFKNCGAKAGASLFHSHSQLIATGMMPNRVQLAVNRMLQYRAQTGCCLQCELIRAEEKEKTRVVAKMDGLIAFCPFASQMPMTVRVTTTEHQDRFEMLSDNQIESVSFLVRRVASWIEKLLPGCSYNYLINTRPPAAEDCADSYHWSLDIFPRVSQIAGFELSSDCMINSIMPEVAAAQLRGFAENEDPRSVL